MAVEMTYENYQEFKKISTHINGKLNRIWEYSSFKSNAGACSEHFEFIQLVNMGPKIIPYIVHRMVEDGADWTHIILLGTITGENPVPDKFAGNFYGHVAHWILWFEDSKYNKKYVYFGLLDDKPEDATETDKGTS